MKTKSGIFLAILASFAVMMIPSEIIAETQRMAPESRAIRELVVRGGAPAKLADEVTRRIKAVNGKEESIPDLLDTKYFLGLIEDRLARALLMLDDVKMATASPRELTSAVSVLTEKRALLRGEPTQRITHEQRTKLNELLPVLIAEARRRGLTIDGKAEALTG